MRIQRRRSPTSRPLMAWRFLYAFDFAERYLSYVASSLKVVCPAGATGVTIPSNKKNRDHKNLIVTVWRERRKAKNPVVAFFLVLYKNNNNRATLFFSFRQVLKRKILVETGVCENTDGQHMITDCYVIFAGLDTREKQWAKHLRTNDDGDSQKGHDFPGGDGIPVFVLW